MIFLQTDAGLSANSSPEANAVRQWALMNNESIVHFDADELFAGDLALSSKDPVVGSVECVSEALRQLGARVPEPDYYPLTLAHHLHRQVAVCPARYIPGYLPDRGPQFVKSHAWKRFTGTVISLESGLDALEKVPPNEWMWIADPVTFIAEWRVYVLDNEILAVCRYDEGAEAVELDMAPVREAVATLAWAEPRAAYVMDWGVLDSGETALVEVGDAWAIGRYSGISSEDYCRCLRARWLEMTLMAGAGR